MYYSIYGHSNLQCFNVFCRESERIKGIKLLLKIFGNIINNPSQTQKYGNLHSNKIMNKLTKCKPGLRLLLLSGFEATENNKRLIWMNTNNNMLKLKNIQNTLKSMIDTKSITINNMPNKTKSQTNNEHDITQLITNIILSEKQVRKIHSIHLFFLFHSC